MFDARKSDTEVIDWMPRIQKVTLGRAYTLIGHNATDVLYFANGIEMVEQNFPFFIIESVDDKRNPFPYHGVLGLSPDVDGDDVLTLGVPLPIHLKNKGRIRRAFVGIDMHKEPSKQSTLTIGKFDTSKFRNTSEKEADLVWFNVPRNTTRFAWRREMKNSFYNQVSFDDGFVNDATFDSFFDGIHLPMTEWRPLMEAIQRNLTAAGKRYLSCDFETNYTCYYQGTCGMRASDWSSFHFNFVDNRAYEITPSSYLVDFKDADGFNICHIGIYGNKHNASEYILGDVFMQSLYVMLDYENSRFAVNGNYITVESMGDKKRRDDNT